MDDATMVIVAIVSYALGVVVGWNLGMFWTRTDRR